MNDEDDQWPNAPLDALALGSRDVENALEDELELSFLNAFSSPQHSTFGQSFGGRSQDGGASLLASPLASESDPLPWPQRLEVSADAASDAGLSGEAALADEPGTVDALKSPSKSGVAALYRAGAGRRPGVLSGSRGLGSEASEMHLPEDLPWLADKGSPAISATERRVAAPSTAARAASQADRAVRPAVARRDSGVGGAGRRASTSVLEIGAGRLNEGTPRTSLAQRAAGRTIGAPQSGHSIPTQAPLQRAKNPAVESTSPASSIRGKRRSSISFGEFLQQSGSPSITGVASVPGSRRSSPGRQRGPRDPGAVKVVVRVRPSLAGESDRRVICPADSKRLLVVNPRKFKASPDAILAAAAMASRANMATSDWARLFEFDEVLWSANEISSTGAALHLCSLASLAGVSVDVAAGSQLHAYNTIGKRLVEDAMDGYQVSCFAYGHTRSGKTYSMFGSAPELLENGPDKELGLGLVPRVCKALLGRIVAAGATPAEPGGVNKECSISAVEEASAFGIVTGAHLSVTLVEIYNDKIRDLLNATRAAADSDRFRVREHPQNGPYIEGLSAVQVGSWEEMHALLSLGSSSRTKADTPENLSSSRGHAVLTLEVTTPSSGAGGGHKGRVQMVDLAGSERGVAAAKPDGGELPTYCMREVTQIKKALSNLGTIIKALSQGERSAGLPYRDSTLTWLLKEGLTGRARMTMLATVAPSAEGYAETMSTLKYAERLRSVQLSQSAALPRTQHGSTDMDPAQLTALRTEFQGLVEQLRAGGTAAARQMLYQTVADPQQRMAKLMQCLLQNETAAVSDGQEKAEAGSDRQHASGRNVIMVGGRAGTGTPEYAVDEGGRGHAFSSDRSSDGDGDFLSDGELTDLGATEPAELAYYPSERSGSSICGRASGKSCSDTAQSLPSCGYPGGLSGPLEARDAALPPAAALHPFDAAFRHDSVTSNDATAAPLSAAAPVQSAGGDLALAAVAAGPWHVEAGVASASPVARAVRRSIDEADLNAGSSTESAWDAAASEGGGGHGRSTWPVPSRESALETAGVEGSPDTGPASPVEAGLAVPAAGQGDITNELLALRPQAGPRRCLLLPARADAGGNEEHAWGESLRWDSPVEHGRSGSWGATADWPLGAKDEPNAALEVYYGDPAGTSGAAATAGKVRNEAATALHLNDMPAPPEGGTETEGNLAGDGCDIGAVSPAHCLVRRVPPPIPHAPEVSEVMAANLSEIMQGPLPISAESSMDMLGANNSLVAAELRTFEAEAGASVSGKQAHVTVLTFATQAEHGSIQHRDGEPLTFLVAPQAAAGARARELKRQAAACSEDDKAAAVGLTAAFKPITASAAPQASKEGASSGIIRVSPSFQDVFKQTAAREPQASPAALEPPAALRAAAAPTLATLAESSRLHYPELAEAPVLKEATQPAVTASAPAPSQIEASSAMLAELERLRSEVSALRADAAEQRIALVAATAANEEVLRRLAHYEEAAVSAAAHEGTLIAELALRAQEAAVLRDEADSTQAGLAKRAAASEAAAEMALAREAGALHEAAAADARAHAAQNAAERSALAADAEVAAARDAAARSAAAANAQVVAAQEAVSAANTRTTAALAAAAAAEDRADAMQEISARSIAAANTKASAAQDAASKSAGAADARSAAALEAAERRVATAEARAKAAEGAAVTASAASNAAREALAAAEARIRVVQEVAAKSVAAADAKASAAQEVATRSTAAADVRLSAGQEAAARSVAAADARAEAAQMALAAANARADAAEEAAAVADRAVAAKDAALKAAAAAEARASAAQEAVAMADIDREGLRAAMGELSNAMHQARREADLAKAKLQQAEAGRNGAVVALQRQEGAMHEHRRLVEEQMRLLQRRQQDLECAAGEESSARVQSILSNEKQALMVANRELQSLLHLLEEAKPDLETSGAPRMALLEERAAHRATNRALEQTSRELERLLGVQELFHPASNDDESDLLSGRARSSGGAVLELVRMSAELAEVRERSAADRVASEEALRRAGADAEARVKQELQEVLNFVKDQSVVLKGQIAKLQQEKTEATEAEAQWKRRADAAEAAAAAAAAEARSARDELDDAKKSSRRELAAAWLAVNKCDVLGTAKDSALQEIQADREKLRRNNDQLTRELGEIDSSLMEALENEGVPWSSLNLQSAARRLSQIGSVSECPQPPVATALPRRPPLGLESGLLEGVPAGADHDAAATGERLKRRRLRPGPRT